MTSYFICRKSVLFLCLLKKKWATSSVNQPEFLLFALNNIASDHRFRENITVSKISRKLG